MTVNIIEIGVDNVVTYSPEINNWSIGLWWDDFEEAGVEKCFLAIESYTGSVVAFQTINIDNQTIAIEVAPDYRKRGIAFQLISESGSITPETNENPEFWEKVARAFGGYDEEDS